MIKNPFNLVVMISLVILFCLIVIPLLQMIASTFTVAKGELRRLPGAEVGDFTLYYWKYLLSGQMAKATLWGPLKNSLVCGFFTVLVSVPLGSVLGWLIARTDIPGKKLLGMLVVIPYMIPSWCKSLSWLAVAIVLCMSLHYYAFSYIHVQSALRSINSELEEMGEICGASKPQILKSITIPLVLPSVLSAVVMTLSKSIGTYGVAANLGNRIGYFTLATKMKNFINGSPQNVGFAMSIVLIALAALIIFANQRIIGVRKSYATIGGKGGRSTEMRLGKAKVPLMIFLLLFLFFAMVMPMFVLIMETFQINTGAGYGLSNLTMYNWIGSNEELAPYYTSYRGIFYNTEFGKAVWNTVRLTVIASVITAFCGQVFIPYLMSGIAFSSMYVAMFSKPHLGGLLPSLYGTFTLIVLTSVVKHFPFASRSGTANMMQIAVELEEAAEINGAGFGKKLTRIVLPLAKNGFISGFMLTFISIAKELDLIIIMMDKRTTTMSYLAFTYSQDGMNQMADAISVCVLMFILICYIIANRFGADIGKSW